MTLNTQLLLEVADKIEADPVRYRQITWGAFLIADEYADDGSGYELYGDVSPSQTLCGTAHCIAGWAMIFSGWTYALEGGTGVWVAPDGSRPRDIDYYQHGATALGFPLQDQPQYEPGTEPGTLKISRLPLFNIFNGGWEPREGLSVPDALRAIAAGATYYDVTGALDGATPKPLSEVKRLANEAVAASNGVSFRGGASDV